MHTLCKIRDIYRSIAEFEARFEAKYNLCFNEAMLLCSLSKSEPLSSGEIAHALGLSTSNTSKIIGSVERKGFIERGLGKEDKRQMYFSLTSKGRKCLKEVDGGDIEIPENLRMLLTEKNSSTKEELRA